MNAMRILEKYEMFEALYIAEAVRIAVEELKLTKKELASRVFLERKDPERVLYSIIGTNKTGKPQRLSLAEAYRLAEVIDKPFPEFCWYVDRKLEIA